MSSKSLVDIEVGIRDAEASDMRLVYSDWVKSYRFKVKDRKAAASTPRTCPGCGRDNSRVVSGGTANGDQDGVDYYDLQRKRIDYLLANARAGVVVVYPTIAPSVVYSWACLDRRDPRVFHYVQTAVPYRNRGYAKMLVAGRSICTHMTDSRREDSFRAWKQRAGFRYQPQLIELLG